MSWFDTAGFASLAKSALSSAQKTIDKALDIKEDPSTFTAADTDSFFLSFGLGEESSSRNLPVKNPVKNVSPPTSSSSSSGTSWSGWGSLFESAQVVVSSPKQPTQTLISNTPPHCSTIPPQESRSLYQHSSPKPFDEGSGDTVSSIGSVVAVTVSVAPASATTTASVATTSFSSTQDAVFTQPQKTSIPVLPPAEGPETTTSSEDPLKQLLPSPVIEKEPEHLSASKQFPVELVASAQKEPECETGRPSIIPLEISTGSDGSTDTLQGNTVEMEYSMVGETSSTIASEQGSSPEQKAQDNSIDKTITSSQETWEWQSMGEFGQSNDTDECSSEQTSRESLTPHQDMPDEHWQESSPTLIDTTLEPKDVKDCDTHSSGSGNSITTSSSASFVQFSVEEHEGSYHSVQPVKSSSPSEHSDAVKLEFEQNSGHTSGDEIETATSSDIEIISSPNGEGSDRCTVSPLKHVWPQRPHKIRRSESPASDSSKDSMMPMVMEATEESKHLGSLDMARISHQDLENEKLMKRLGDLQDILDARERKVFTLSKENAELHEMTTNLQNALRHLEETRAKESQDVSGLTQEFTHRLAKLETKLQDTLRERDILLSQLHTTQQEASTKVSISQMEQVVREKDQQIAELMDEGEKLSKQQLQQSTIIKKLRSKEKEMENLIKTNKEKLEEQGKELDRLRKSMNAKDDQEKKHIDTIRQLTSANQKLEKEFTSLRESLEESNEKVATFKNKLESAYREIQELVKANAEKENQMQEASLSAKMAANEELRQALEQTKVEAENEKGVLLKQIEDLQMSMTLVEQQAQRREEVLRLSISDLQTQLQESEARNQDITQNLSSASRPLLRQIENLQSTFTTQASSWEKVEKNLTDRLSEAQTQVMLLTERERSASEKCMELRLKITSLESQLSTLRQDKNQLMAELDSLKQEQTRLEELKEREDVSLESTKKKLQMHIQDLEKEKEEVQNSLRQALSDLEKEKQRSHLLQEEIREKENQTSLSDFRPPSPTASQYSSISDTVGMSASVMEEPVCRMSLYEALRASSGTSLLESLQSQLKMRDGECGQLQAEIAQLERVRDSMTQELMSLTCKYDHLEQNLDELKDVKTKLEDLEQKYNTLLQMYGEKVEEAEELRLDLDDVKTMYRAQITELLASSR